MGLFNRIKNIFSDNKSNENVSENQKKELNDKKNKKTC